MSNELPKLDPVTIIITSYNRITLLNKTIDRINKRTFYPYRIIVVDNNSEDGSVGMLKTMKVQGRIFDHVLLPNNVGQSRALNEAFKVVEDWESNKRRPSSDFYVTTNDDIYPPMLGQDNCWLRRMITLLEDNEPDYGGLCMRVQRTARNQIDESKDIIPCYKGFPSVFRIMRRSDIRKMGNRPWGRLMKWDSNTSGDKFKTVLTKKYGFATHIYADHAGFIINSGYDRGVDTFTVAENKIRISEEKPYPDIDPETNIPTKINHPVDTAEQNAREEHANKKRDDVTVLILTCHRLNALDKLISGINIKNSKLLVIIDKDDTNAYNYCVHNNINCIMSNHHRDFVAQANLGIYICDTKYFIILGDDMSIPENQDLVKASLEEFEKAFPDGVGLMSFNEGIQKGRIFTTGMSSKRFVERVGGHLYYPGYKHYKGDREVTEIAKRMKLYHYADGVITNHNHFSKGSKKDRTYIDSEVFARHDRLLYWERRNIENINNKYDY